MRAFITRNNSKGEADCGTDQRNGTHAHTSLWREALDMAHGIGDHRVQRLVDVFASN